MVESRVPIPLPEPDQRRAVLRWAGCLLALGAELGVYSYISREAREMMHGILRVPLLRLSFLGFLVILFAWRIGKLTLNLPARPNFGRAAFIHICSALTVGLLLDNIQYQTLRSPVMLGFGTWLLVTAWFAMTWLNCLVEPLYWRLLMRRYGILAIIIYLLVVAAESVRRTTIAQFLVDGSISLATLVLRIIGHEPTWDKATDVMGLAGFTVQVGYLCSGMEGIGLIITLMCLYLIVRREELVFPSALLLLPIAAILSWVLNGFRLAFLTMLGAFVSREIALDAFHSRAGWIAFVFLGVALLAIVESFHLFHKAKDAAHDFPSLPFLAPMAVQLFLSLAFAAFVSGLDIFYPARILLVIGAVAWFRQDYRRLSIWDCSLDIRALFLGVGVYIFWVALLPYEPQDDPRHSLPETVASLWMISRLLGSVLVVPIVEELAFRGYLLRRLQKREFWSVPMSSLTFSSVMLSSLAFGLLHQAWFAGFLAGVAYAYAGKIRGQLTDAVVAHAVTNLCIAVHVVLFSRWDLWV